MQDSMEPPLEEQPGYQPPSIGSGPVQLEPDQSVRLQTYADKDTTLHIENDSGFDGGGAIQWGAMNSEVIHCVPGHTNVERNFGGIPVRITNTGNVPISVETT